MAQKAKASSKTKSTRTAAAKTTAKRAAASNVVTKSKASEAPVRRFATVTPQALVAEAIGTFGLALAALTAPTDQPLLVGLSLTVLLIGMISVSGGHFNPAVTFGLWAMNKLEVVARAIYRSTRCVYGRWLVQW